MATIDRLQRVFDSIFLDPFPIHSELSAKSVDQWDSLMQINLIVSVEKEFGISFALGEVELADNVGEFVELIDKHLSHL